MRVSKVECVWGDEKERTLASLFSPHSVSNICIQTFLSDACFIAFNTTIDAWEREKVVENAIFETHSAAYCKNFSLSLAFVYELVTSHQVCHFPLLGRLHQKREISLMSDDNSCGKADEAFLCEDARFCWSCLVSSLSLMADIILNHI